MSGNYAMATGSLRACYELGRASFTLGPCAAGELDRVTAGGSGAIASASGSTGWMAVGAGGIAAWHLAPWVALTARAEATAPLARPRFLVDGSEAAYRVPVASLRVAVGFELTIP